MVGHFGATLRHFGVSLGSLWGLIQVIRAILEAYVSHVEKLKMAHVCRECSICPILVPKKILRMPDKHQNCFDSIF